MSAAFFVHCQGLIGELLDHFEGFAAAFAFVFVKGQCPNSTGAGVDPGAVR
jgi:hypothetical protein